MRSVLPVALLWLALPFALAAGCSDEDPCPNGVVSPVEGQACRDVPFWCISSGSACRCPSTGKWECGAADMAVPDLATHDLASVD